jgi:hypothetical protein
MSFRSTESEHPWDPPSGGETGRGSLLSLAAFEDLKFLVLDFLIETIFFSKSFFFFGVKSFCCFENKIHLQFIKEQGKHNLFT